MQIYIVPLAVIKHCLKHLAVIAVYFAQKISLYLCMCLCESLVLCFLFELFVRFSEAYIVIHYSVLVVMLCDSKYHM